MGQLTQTTFQVQQILDRVEDVIVDDNGIIKVYADEYYGDGSHLTGVQTSTEHNELTGLEGGVTGGTNGEYYHLTSAEYDEVKGNALNLKAMQFVGVCKRCNFQPTDIVIDPVANTISIPTVNGIAISESNPLRYFTDGDGIVHEHVQTTTAVASFTNTTGVWYVHFDSNSNFVCTQVPWSDFDLIATVYRFYLNATLPDAIKIVVRAYEGHLNVMSAEVHAWLHSQGTVHLNGFELVHNVLPITALGVPTISPNVDGRNTVISFTSGRNSDDGLEYTVTHSTTPTLPFSQNLGEQSAIALNSTNSGLFKIRTNDVNGILNFLPATRFPFVFNATTNIPQYITSTGVRTDVSDNSWFVYYAYALQDDKPTEPVKLVSAENQFTTYALAQSHDWINLQALYPTLRDKEIRPLYKLIFYCNSAQGGAYDVAVKYSGLISYVDIRTYKTQNVNASSSSASVLASNVIVTPANGFVSIDQQSFDNEIATKHNAHVGATGATNPHATSFNNLTSTAHTHTIGNVLNLQSSLDSKLSLSGGTLTGSLSGTSISATTFYGDGSNLTGVVSTHNALSGLQGGLVNERYHLNISDYQKVTGGTFALNSSLSAHTGDTSIHFTKSSINLSDLGSSGHTHSITDVLNLQTSLNNKTDLSLFNSHTGDTNPHQTKFSDLITTAHTHTISGVTNLQSSLDSKLNLSGGTMTGTLIGTTISATTYQGIKASQVANDSTNVSGANLKVILDNATLAVDGLGIQNSDLFPISREVQSGATFISTNMYHSWDRIKTDIKNNSGVRFVSNETDLNSALQSNVDSMCIVVTEPITTTSSLNCIPTNIHITGQDIIYSGGTMLFISTNPSTSIYFDSPVGIGKTISNTSVISTSGETVWGLTFRNIVSERPIIINSNGITTGRVDIVTTNDMSINVSGSTGTRMVTINKRLDNTGFHYRNFSQQGYNQVYSEITDSGNFTVKAHLTFQKDEVGSIILMPSDSNVMLHPSKFTITYLKSDLVNVGATGISGNIDFPRFDGEGEQVTLSLNATNKAERYIYIVPDGNGSVEYNNSTERAIMLQNGNWVLNFTGSALGATQQNRVWYSIVITGHADTTTGNWILI